MDSKKKKKTEKILEVWTNLKEKLSKIISLQTNQPTELLSQKEYD